MICDLCERSDAWGRWRFCKGCLFAARREMNEAGYFQETEHRTYRTDDVPGPRECGPATWDNVVRLIEDQ